MNNHIYSIATLNLIVHDTFSLNYPAGNSLQTAIQNYIPTIKLEKETG